MIFSILAASRDQGTASVQSQFDWTTLITSALIAALISSIVAIIGQWVARQNAKLAAEIAQSNAKLAANLEVSRTLSQSRQEWINVLREDMAEFIGICSIRLRFINGEEDLSDEEFARMISLSSRIRLRLNPDDEDFDELWSLMGSCASEADPRKLGRFSNKFAKVSQKILKQEWDVLKDELNQISAAETSDD